jgi:hypothetical protein
MPPATGDPIFLGDYFKRQDSHWRIFDALGRLRQVYRTREWNTIRLCPGCLMVRKHPTRLYHLDARSPIAATMQCVNLGCVGEALGMPHLGRDASAAVNILCVGRYALNNQGAHITTLLSPRPEE